MALQLFLDIVANDDVVETDDVLDHRAKLSDFSGGDIPEIDFNGRAVLPSDNGTVRTIFDWVVYRHQVAFDRDQSHIGRVDRFEVDDRLAHARAYLFFFEEK